MYESKILSVVCYGCGTWFWYIKETIQTEGSWKQGKTKVKLPLCFSKHNDMGTYEGVEV
jgi:hypothetical protein